VQVNLTRFSCSPFYATHACGYFMRTPPNGFLEMADPQVATGPGDLAGPEATVGKTRGDL